jgi:hypothetical protein
MPIIDVRLWRHSRGILSKFVVVKLSPYHCSLPTLVDVFRTANVGLLHYHHQIVFVNCDSIHFYIYALFNHIIQATSVIRYLHSPYRSHLTHIHFHYLFL